MTISKLLILALTAALAAPLWAHEEHNHEAAVEAAPHGGILRNAGLFKAELVLNKDNAKIYLYDKDMKAVDAKRLTPSAKGRLAFPKDKTKREVKFELKDGTYQAQLPGIGKVHRYDLHVDLSIDGKPVLGDFGIDNIH